MALEVLIFTIEVCAVCLFATILSGLKTIKAISSILFIASGTIVLTLIDIFSLNQSVYFIAVVIMTFLYLSSVTSLSFEDMLTISLIPCLFRSILHSLYLAVFSILFFRQIDPTAVYLRFGILVDAGFSLLFFIFCFILAWLFQRQKLLLDREEKWLFSIILLTGQMLADSVADMLFIVQIHDHHLAIMILCTVILIVLLCFLLTDITKKNMENRRIQYEKSLLDSQLSANKKLLQSQQELYRLRHDIRHLLNTMDDSGVSGAQLQTMQKTFAGSDIPLQTRSAAVNTVLNVKKQQARDKGIDFILLLNITEELPLEKEDACLFLANLIDNAIEHIGKEKRIVLELLCDAEVFTLRLCNSVDSVENETMLLPGHGYGIPTIQELVRKYHGDIRFVREEGEYTVFAMIPGRDI